MRSAKRVGRLGRYTLAILVGLGSVTSASLASALTPLPNVDCQSAPVREVEALPITSMPFFGNTLYTYQSDVTGTLYNALRSDPDSKVLAFTEAYYGIPGAADYYYIVRNFNQRDDKRYWVAIPIIDEQSDILTNPVGFDTSYPGLPNVRFPAFSAFGSADLYAYAVAVPQLWPESNGMPMGHWVADKPSQVVTGGGATPYPFLLRNSDQSALATVLAEDPAKDPHVGPQDATCVLIRDPFGNVLDFVAHLTEWDPQPSCPGCY